MEYVGGFLQGSSLHRERVNGAPHGCLIHATSDIGRAVESGAGHIVEYRLLVHCGLQYGVVFQCIFGALCSTLKV